MEDDMIKYGTPEHAAEVTDGRHPGIKDGLQWLTFSHLPIPLRRFSEPFYDAAVHLIKRVTTDSPELTTAVNGLIAAKDSAVRAGIRHNTGRAGSIPRPQAVTEPPSLTGDGAQLAYSEQTMDKVVAALRAVGLADEGVTAAIIGMQNQGILFRERS